MNGMIRVGGQWLLLELDSFRIERVRELVLVAYRDQIQM